MPPLSGTSSRQTPLTTPLEPDEMQRPSYQSYRTTLLDDSVHYGSDDEDILESSHLDCSVLFDDEACVAIDMEKRTKHADIPADPNVPEKLSIPELAIVIENRKRAAAAAESKRAAEHVAECSAQPSIMDDIDDSFFTNLRGISQESKHEEITIDVTKAVPVYPPRQSKPKRRLSSVSDDTNQFPDVVKRMRRTSTLSKTDSITPVEDDDNDDWLFLADLSHIKTYNVSDIMAYHSTRRSVLAALTAPTRMASKTMTKIKRKCDIALHRHNNQPVYKPVTCVATGSVGAY